MLGVRLRAGSMGARRGYLREQLVQLRIAAQVNCAVVRYHRVEGTVGKEEGAVSAPDVEADRGPGAERREIHDVADDCRRARDPITDGILPAHRAGPGVERVEVAVIGPDVDGWSQSGDVLHGG